MARLADAKTVLNITKSVYLTIRVYGPDESLGELHKLLFYVIDSLGMEVIIGLPSLVGPYFQEFVLILESAHRAYVESTQRLSLMEGDILEPWSLPLDQMGQEEIETPDALAFGADILYYLTTSRNT